MRPCRYHPVDLLPHRPPRVLLDEILGYDETSLRAAVTVSEKSLFLEPEGVPVHVGLEYMAQACGAFAGALARDRGEAVRIGFVLGARQYRAHVPCFRRGERLMVSVAVLYQDQQMGAFSCRIEIGGRLAAEARLNVYQPDPTELSGGMPAP